jgi:hypothetical protein
MSALLIVANQYGLNPWTKEIYAFPDKNNGIVPGGRRRRLVAHHQRAPAVRRHGLRAGRRRGAPASSTARTARTRRKVTEYLSECKRGVKPWQSHPKRMLRHKAMIQCARLAFGYVGIFDQDEAERITEVDINQRPARQGAAAVAEQAMTVEFTEAHQKLLADLEAVADTGIEALEASWAAITKEQRRALASHLPNLKARAAKVIDMEAGHA